MKHEERADLRDSDPPPGIPVSIGRIERIELREEDHQDAWVCICGNKPTYEGFYPCLKDGTMIEPTKDGPWDGRLYACDRCGRIIDQFTGEVVGRAVITAGTMNEEAWRIHDASISIEHWVPDPERPGYLKFTGTPTYRAVFRALRQRLQHEGLLDEYFEESFDDDQTGTRHDKGAQALPRIRWIAAWAVVGGSEGHYIHVDLVHKDGRHEPFALGKTFQGWDHAWRIAKRVAELLGEGAR